MNKTVYCNPVLLNSVSKSINEAKISYPYNIKYTNTQPKKSGKHL